MVIARKLLTPTLAFFAVVLVATIAYFANTAQRSLVLEEERYLNSLQQAMEGELARMSNVSLALAKQNANSREVRSAFFEGDKELLKTLSQSSYTRIKGEYRILEHEYTLAPATVFLNLDEPQTEGQDLSKVRLTLVAANTQQRDIATLELVDYGLCVHGIAVMQGESSAGAVVKGSVEYSIALDRRVFNELHTKYGGDWQVLLSKPAMEKSGLDLTASTTEGPRPDLRLSSTTLSQAVYASEHAYDEAMRGKTTLARATHGSSTYAIMTVPLRDFRGLVVATVDILWDRTDALAALRNRMLLAVAGGILGLLVGFLALARIINAVLQPVKALTVAAQAIARGDLRHPLPPMRRQGRQIDEIEDLTRSFHSMSQQLRQLVGNLETMVSERTQGLEQRTQQIQAAAEIAREVTMLSDVDTLLVQAVNLVRLKFNYYHAGVFLIDETGEMAVLRAATGEAGQQMLEQGHKLQVGQVGLVGAACATGEPKVAGEVAEDSVHFKNPLLPETRSEIAVPLRAGSKIIGALDVQSRSPEAFQADDITVLQVIADQLAIAVNNAQLIQQLNRSVNELEEAHGQMTRENWQAVTRRHASGYRYVSAWSESGDGREAALEVAQAELQGGLAPLGTEAAPAEAQEAMRLGQAVISGEAAAVPIRLRGRPIGAMHLRFDSPVAQREVTGLMEEMSNRLGLVLESARLLEEARRLAQREQQINLIATEMRSSVNLDTILQNTVRELGKALGARRAFIQLGEVDSQTLSGPDDEVRSGV